MKRPVLSLVFLLVLAALLLVPSSAPATQPGPGHWVAGDLHVHTQWGHDTCINPMESWDNKNPNRSARQPCDEPWTWSFSVEERIREAELRGLDYLAITDHNNVMWQSDPFVTSYYGSLLLVPGFESSLPGHVQMLGASSCWDNSGPVSDPVVECHKAVLDQSVSGMIQLRDALHAAGGVFQVNHPSDHDWESRYGHNVVPATVEVWNIGPWIWQPPLPAANDNDFSLDWWDGFLSAGHHVGTTGGSDSHWRITQSEQGIGQPTTWVWVEHDTIADVLAGLRAGRTYVSAQPPLRGGKNLYLEADADGDGIFEAMVGDTVSATSSFRVRSDADPGSLMRIVTDQGTTEMVLSGLGSYDITDAVSPGVKFVRAEIRALDLKDTRRDTCDMLVSTFGSTWCRNSLLMQALSSAIYLTP